ncbi:hypothetical protein [Streptomyces sp. NPDC059076]|uniref:hypothetical protein n=1 Tax=unclassified Streptomyces TaxID=2593676 RepID=UPI0036927786
MGDDLEGVLDDTAGVHHGIDLIREGIRHLATTPHTADQTQVVLAALTGEHGADLITAIGLLVRHLTSPDTNPSLRTLPTDRRETVTELGQQYAYLAAEFTPRRHATEAIAHIDPNPDTH